MRFMSGRFPMGMEDGRSRKQPDMIRDGEPMGKKLFTYRPGK